MERNNLARLKACFSGAPAFLYGLLFGQEIFYFAKANSVYFNVSTLLMAGICIFYLIKDFHSFFKVFASIGFLFYFLIVAILFSYVNSLFFIESSEEFIVEIKGTAMFFINAGLTIFTLILIKQKMKFVMAGLYFAFVMNFFMSFIVFFTAFFTGFVVSLSDLLPQPAFYVPFGGEIQLQGFFKEPSGITGFISVSYFVLCSYYKDIFHRLSLFFMAVFIYVLAGSGNVVVFVLLYFVIALFNMKKIHSFIRGVFQSKRKRIFAFFFVGCFAGVCILLFALPSTRSRILQALVSVNPLSNDNYQRLNHMIAGLDIALKYPWGVGFNLASVIVGREVSGLEQSTYVYNVFIARFIELGFFGMVLWLLMFAVPAFKLLFSRYFIKDYYLGASLLGVILLEFLTGNIFQIHYLALGLAYIEIREHQEMIVPVVSHPRGTKNSIFWD